MTYLELMRLTLSLPEFIELIKLKGTLIEHNVIELPNNKYSEPVLMLFEDLYFVLYSVFENHYDSCPFEDYEEFNSEFQGRNRYSSLLNELTIGIN